MIALFKKPKPDLRKQIEGAKIIDKKEATVMQRLKKKLRRRKLKKENDAILREVLDDATFTSNVTVPKTYAEALPDDAEKRATDPRAIVVTEAWGSFNMVGCNKAWENLCGFAECEIVGKDSSILQGPDTNIAGLHDAVSRLFEGEKKVHVVTTNYRKDGSKFTNFLTLAPLRDEASGKLTHFVAILNDIGGSIGKKTKA
jgi:PAS domain S-box-containing protein